MTPHGYAKEVLKNALEQSESINLSEKEILDAILAQSIEQSKSHHDAKDLLHLLKYHIDCIEAEEGLAITRGC